MAAATEQCKLQLSALQAKFDENADHKERLEDHTHKLQASCEGVSSLRAMSPFRLTRWAVGRRTSASCSTRSARATKRSLPWT